MKQHSFYSHFADHILRFIEYKNNLGYPYEDSIRILWNFDPNLPKRLYIGKGEIAKNR